jgi:hypothetical protein
MRQVHRAGEKAFVDFSGKKPKVVDARTGEEREVELFVGVLGASSYIFAEAVERQDLTNWIGLNVRMVEAFGGSPAVFVPDNLKSAVTSPCRYEPEVNRTYREGVRPAGAQAAPSRPLRDGRLEGMRRQHRLPRRIRAQPLQRPARPGGAAGRDTGHGAVRGDLPEILPRRLAPAPHGSRARVDPILTHASRPPRSRRVDLVAADGLGREGGTGHGLRRGRDPQEPPAFRVGLPGVLG